MVKIKPEYIFPLLLILLDVGAAIIYAVQKDYKKAVYLCNRNISKHIDKKVFEIKFDPETGFFGESDTSNICPSDFYMCEIIGNVFDTPEFLKAGEMP